MHAVGTTDGGLYTANNTLWDYLCLKYPVIHSPNVKFTLLYAGSHAGLHMVFDATHSATIWNPCLDSAMSQLLRIQNAVRDWLHRRRLPSRLEAALFLQATLPCDVANLVIRALH